MADIEVKFKNQNRELFPWLGAKILSESYLDVIRVNKSVLEENGMNVLAEKYLI